MPVLFLDFDDTLSEQIPFNMQYVRGIGTALAALYGGDTEEWARHGADMMLALEADYAARFRDAPLNGYCAWLPLMLSRAVEMLFAGMGLSLPPDPRETAFQMRDIALSQCDSLFPGARTAIRTLHECGFLLHMASGNDSAHLRAALRGAGLDVWFRSLYGPDLIDCAKEGPQFYERIFTATGVPPREALIIDNDPAAIAWACTAGARAIQVKLLPYRTVETAAGAAAAVTDLARLPEVVQALSSDAPDATVS